VIAARLVAPLAVLVACKAADPPATPDGRPRPDARAVDAGPDAVPVDANPACQPLPGDYTGAADDAWPACISDDGLYHPFDHSITTVARVAAFESIATILFTGAAPSRDDFLDARALYLQDQGLESRVVRREDEHYPPAPGACSDPEVAAAHPDRCVGAARLHPLIHRAFEAGQDPAASDRARRVAAAEIEAGLLWFLTVSVYKEVITCTTTPRDCDSGWAYYTGGEPRAGGHGLARYVRARDGATHDRAWDGLLAIRCWRDLDNPTGVATDLATRDRAAAQLDRAVLRGVALIVRGWTIALAAATGDAAAARWAQLRVLWASLDRDATLRDPADAAALRAELARADPAAVDTGVIVDALDRLYPCP
jgi:hypothetical protein